MQLLIDIQLGNPYTMTITQTPDPTAQSDARRLGDIYPNRNNLIGALARTWAAVLAETPGTSVSVSVCGDRATCTSDMAEAIARIEYLLSEEEDIRAAA